MKFFGFRGGVHPPENKLQTETFPVEKLEAPKMLYVPLLQHIGAPLDPLVAVGDQVLKGQKIADSQGFLTSPIHSPVSGTVKKIEERVFPLMGTCKSIVIENDGQETWAELSKIENWETAEVKDLLAMIREKGIVGIGGASFPTHVKLNPPADTKIDTLLLNGAECEPYLNSDNRLMLENPSSIIEGVKIIKKILGVSTAIIGIEENKPEAIANMKKAAEGTGIEIAPLKTKYPQGGEKQLIKAVLNREVPSGKLPSSVGVVVQNTGTAAAIYEGLVHGTPLIEKVVTVSGKAIATPKNVRIAIGTPFSYLLDACGVDREKVDKLVMGGPMMGMAQFSEEAPVIKGTSGLLALTTEETNPYKPKACIGCGKCVSVCPMSLEPVMFARLAAFQQWEGLQHYHLMDCIECGSCAFICPANRPLTEAIKIGKAKLRSMKK
ncbi:electron transport complex subunit RsxC [Fusobacterium gonidiaformans]|uniref:electron transport complex subunit RsxC n=1 Tax=Fusobacterium gonidiaformans TaxID=849 RepID=UPI00307E7883